MNEIDQIKRAIYRNTLERILISTLIIAAGIGILILPRELPEQTLLLFQIVAAILVISGLYLFISGLGRLNTSLDQLIISLQDNPRNIVWFYSYMVVNMPFGVRVLKMATIFLFTVEGKKIALRVKEKELDQFMGVLERLLPHASNGYSVEREQLFKASPALLYRN